MIAEVANHLWQSTVFTAAVGLLALAFRKNRAHVRYWLWLSASVKFLIPFSLLMSVGHDLLGKLAAGKIARVIATPALSGTIVQAAQPFPDTMTLAPAAQDTTHWTPIVILGVWACGFAAVALLRFRAWLRVRAALRASTPINIQAPVAVRSCPELLEPGVVGFFRPIVLLPEGILETLTRPQMEAVLAHELSHGRRLDNLTAAIHMVVEAVFWFYPLVWWIGARLVEERERACDESVLTLGSEPREYADAILNVCKHYVKSPVVCVSGIIGADLKRRIVHIMARHIGERLTRGRKWLLGAAAAVAIAIPLALGMTGASRGATQSAEASNGGLPSFATVSIKVNNAPRAVQIFTFTKDRFIATESAMNMIMFAYGEQHPLKPVQVLGGPDWIMTVVFIIDGELSKSLSDQVKPPLHLAGPPLLYPAEVRRTDAVKQVFRLLLINRFKLRVRHEKKVLPVYDLVLAKNGPKVAEDKTSDQPCRMGGLGPGEGLWLDVKSCDFPTFVGVLSASHGLWDRALSHGRYQPREVQLSRVLVDKTGLHGRYSFKLHWTPHIYTPPGTPKPSGPSLFTALQEQLGLRIVPGKAPVKVLVIEHIERPTPN